MPTARLSILIVLPLALGCDGGGATPEQQTAGSLVPAPPAPAKPGPEAQAAYDRARSIYQAGDGPAALVEARRAVELAPGWLEARMQLGKLALTLSSVNFGTATREQTLFRESIAQFEAAHRFAPLDVEVSYWWGHAFFSNKQYAEAIPHFEHALGLDPQHKLAQKELALAQVAEGNSAQAKVALQRARELLPKDDEVLFQLGLQLKDEDELDGAIALFQEAVRLNPAHAGPRTQLVALYQRLGREADAQKAAEDLARSKEFAKRLSQATKRAEQNPRDPAALAEVGALYLELDMLDAGRSWVERALRLDPQGAEARRLQQMIQMRVEQAEQEKQLKQLKEQVLIAPAGADAQEGKH
ncbi:MAG: tetratricopeptide repeat protein [Planctomycetes bacterium]|nr:tetratricopeptide repeat protein [Planctomycetota bacterium]